MAKTANDESVKRDEDGPAFDEVIGLIRGAVRNNQAEVSSIAQDSSTIYKRIEKQLGVHRGAAKQFAAIDGMAPEKREDFLRSLLGLLTHAGYANFNDLVDRAQRPTKAAKGAKAKDKADTPPATDLETSAHPDQLAREADPMFDEPESGNVTAFPGRSA